MSQGASCLLDASREAPLCFARARRGTEWVLDLGDGLRVQPTAYRLRDSLSERMDVLASWDLDAWVGEGAPTALAP